jgi:hypothetical protein
VRRDTVPDKCPAFADDGVSFGGLGGDPEREQAQAERHDVGQQMEGVRHQRKAVCPIPRAKLDDEVGGSYRERYP